MSSIKLKSANLKKAIESHKQQLSQVLQSMVQIRSYSGEEKDIVEYIVNKMNEFCFEDAYVDSLGNAVGKLGDGPVMILFDAHLDTVKVTGDEQWQYPPFEGRISDNKIYGRGVLDEKAAMAGFLIAGKVIKKQFSEQQLPFTLYVVGSVLEENCDGYPLLHLIETEKVHPDYVLLGEPTDLKVYRGQRGRMEMQIITRGESAHGAHNHQGINAIYKMQPIIKDIEFLNNKMDYVEPLGKGAITISEIKSNGPSLCSVPDFCQIHIDRRLTKGETRESALKQLNDIIESGRYQATLQVPAVKGKSWTGLKFEQEAYFPTWILEEDHLLVRSGLEAARLALGRDTESGFWHFSTNGVASAGRLGIPTIGFAPGKEQLAHTNREEIDLDDLLKATHFYSILPFVICENPGD